MEYALLFRPVFSFAAHAARTCGGAEGNRARECFADLDQALAEIRRRRSGGERFDQAWFALCAWLDETLAVVRADLGETAPPPFLARHFPGASGADGEFFDRLDALLPAARSGKAGARRVLAVYHLCLVLGYRGPFRHEEDEGVLANWRARCRDALREKAAHGKNSPLRPPPCALKKKSRFSRIAWLTPPAATIALFFLYRFLLSNLYAAIME